MWRVAAARCGMPLLDWIPQYSTAKEAANPHQASWGTVKEFCGRAPAKSNPCTTRKTQLRTANNNRT